MKVSKIEILIILKATCHNGNVIYLIYNLIATNASLEFHSGIKPTDAYS